MFAWKGFRPLYKRTGLVISPLPQIIGNSRTLMEGSSVIYIGGDGIDVNLTSSTDYVYGYCVGFVTPNGTPLKTIADNTAYFNGTYTAAATGDKCLSRSTNLTTDKIMAQIVSAVELVCSGYPDSAPATTTGSDLGGYYMDIEATAANAGTMLDESTAATTAAEFINIPNSDSNSAKDPTDTRRVICIANEIQQYVMTVMS
jgi:hypothetical protein